MKLQLFIIGLVFWGVIGRSEEFRVDTTQTNTVIFFARATMGSFSGETNHITGYLKWEGDDTLGSSRVVLDVDLSTLDTGIGLRNKHMREKYLETDKYPIARFEGRLVKWVKKESSLDKVTVKGTLTIHGVEQPFTREVTLVNQGEQYRVSTLFKLNITDFGIQQPKYLVVSMDPVVTLRLVFYLKSQ